MKEKDIVDFSKMEETEDGFVIDEDGNEIGCKICHTHEKAFEILSKNLPVFLRYHTKQSHSFKNCYD